MTTILTPLYPAALDAWVATVLDRPPSRHRHRAPTPEQRALDRQRAHAAQDHAAYLRAVRRGHDLR